MGYAEDIEALTDLWRQPTLWTQWCSRGAHKLNAQCIATRIMLNGNVSIELDGREALFASGVLPRPGPASTGNGPHMMRVEMCGDEPCRSSRRLEWLRELGGSLVRPTGYREACGVLDDAPLLLHFSGGHKPLMKDPILMAWLARQGL